MLESLCLWCALASARARGSDPYLDATASLLLEEDVFGLQIAVNDAVFLERIEALEDAVGELAHELKTKTLKFVLLNEFVEVHRKELESDAYVIPEHEAVQHVDDVV